MKALFNLLLDGLTFKDIAGKRQLRTYVLLSGVILILLITLVSGSALESNSMLSKVRGTPVSVQVTPQPTVTNAPTATLSAACPTNPQDWRFVDVFPDDNFKRIEPTCVYEDLSKSVAWALAVREGYTRAEAMQTLGFPDLPMQRLNQVMAMTNTRGPLSLEMSFTPPHPDFAEWRVDKSGSPAISYALRGCFRTDTIVGNKSEAWNADDAVICALSEDSAATQVVIKLNSPTYTSSAAPTRSFVLFGYTTDGKWLWLGTQQEPRIDLGTLPDPGQEAKFSAEQYGAILWDATWLQQAYGLSMKPLPENWQGATFDADRNDILSGLNIYLNKGKP
jgi:hypothetical protein